MSAFEAQCARDAEGSAYGSEGYAEYLEETCKRHRDYFLAKGDPEMAERMMTRTLSEALMGNDGD
jgi:hypothetical protein